MSSSAAPGKSETPSAVLKLDGPLIWKQRDTWHEPLTAWLTPRLNVDALARLNSLGEQDICWDDPDWLTEILAPELDHELGSVVAELADALDGVTVRAYHGCRVEDAGVFHREGLRVNDPSKCAEDVRRIVGEEDDLAWMRPDLEKRLGSWEHRERDTGKVYLCLDDRFAVEYAAHYALYGSEWLTAFLGFGAHSVLRSRGVPTYVEVNVPLSWTRHSLREELARDLLHEWTRQVVNQPDWLPAPDFTISLHHDVPPEHIVGHFHPAVLKCPFSMRREFRSKTTVCPGCQ